jgi:catechol 2,3-dioxygenase-like lactoylglutathione lyase family enzyme
MRRTLLSLLTLTAAFAQAPDTPVVRLQNLAHTTADLRTTAVFYRDVVGLPMNAAPGQDPLNAVPAKMDAENSRFTNTQGASFRAAIFRVPNAEFGFELTEFTGVPRKTQTAHIQNPGAATLVLQIRDMDKMLAKLKAAGTPIVTTGGVPLNPSGANNAMRELVVRDPDGFFVEFQRPDPLPASAATTEGDILGGSVQLAIEDSEKSVAFYRAAIGFNARPTGGVGSNETVLKIIGLAGAQWRITHGSIAGTSLDWGLIEYRGVERKPLLLGAEDPGSPAFTMVVRDIDAAVERWKSSGGTVVSAGGVAMKRPNGAGNVFVRDINGFMWEFIQRAPTPGAK